MRMRPRLTGRPQGRLVRRGPLTMAVGISLLLGTLTGGATAAAAVRAVPHSCAETPGHVSLVVDFGTVTGVPYAGVFTACVALADRDSGLALLQKAGLAPRLTPAGMVCGIGGYPDTGCGVPSATNFLYWSYWHGDASGWVYATAGAGSYRPVSGDVEGWRFIDGQDSSNGVGLSPPRDLFGIGPSYLASNISGPIPAGTVPPNQPSGGAGSAPSTVAPGTAPTGGPGAHGPDGPSTTVDGVGTPTTTAPSSSSTSRSGEVRPSKDAPRITSRESAPTLNKAQLREADATRGNVVPIGAIIGAFVGVAAIVALIGFGIVRAGKRRNV